MYPIVLLGKTVTLSLMTVLIFLTVLILRKILTQLCSLETLAKPTMTVTLPRSVHTMLCTGMPVPLTGHVITTPSSLMAGGSLMFAVVTVCVL